MLPAFAAALGMGNFQDIEEDMEDDDYGNEGDDLSDGSGDLSDMGGDVGPHNGEEDSEDEHDGRGGGDEEGQWFSYGGRRNAEGVQMDCEAPLMEMQLWL